MKNTNTVWKNWQSASITSNTCLSRSTHSLHQRPRFANASLPLASGALLAGRYRIQTVTHQGDGWRLYQAKDAWSGKLVTVKQTALLAGRCEARLLQQLSHPLLPRLQQVIYRGGAAYLVITFVEGTPLHHLLSSCPLRRPSVAQVLRIGQLLADLLAYLHGQRLSFLSFPPASVQVSSTGLLLIDLSMVRSSSQLSTHITDVEELRALLLRLLPENAPSVLANRIAGPGWPISAGTLHEALRHLSQQVG